MLPHAAADRLRRPGGSGSSHLTYFYVRYNDPGELLCRWATQIPLPSSKADASGHPESFGRVVADVKWFPLARGHLELVPGYLSPGHL